MSNPSENTEYRSRILVVDDTPANLRLLTSILHQNGYIVHSANGAETALRFLQSTLPDLILLDVLMPGMDGYDLCRKLKSNPRTSDIPVIFISSAGQMLDKIRAFVSGGVDYVVRPIQAEEVLARVSTHLSLRKLQTNLENLVRERTAALEESNLRLQQENLERKRAEEHIHHMAHYDALTDLPNRVLLQDRIKQAIAHARRWQTRVGVMFIDLDHFKHINDSLGHHVGDCLIQMVANRLTRCVREGDSVARLGGDEFVICLPALNEAGDAEVVAQKVIETLKQPFIVDAHSLHVSCSIGISIFPDDAEDVGSLMRMADTAMYATKEQGRNNLQFFKPAMDKAAHLKLDLTSRLRHALAGDEFVLFYQPQVDMETGEIFSAEALLRWKLPGQAPVSCATLISIAEETGLILPIGEWVLRQACTQLKRWHNEGFTTMHMAVNLSPRQFYQSDLGMTVQQVLNEFELEPELLDLEITESILLQQSHENIAVLKRLGAMGVQLSVDDFGTGYSNLAFLQRFPIHALKIDRSFISDIGRDTNNTALVTAIIAMARSLGLKILAEGVETEYQSTFLMSHGCIAAQGHYYSEAISAEDFTNLLQKRVCNQMAIQPS